MAQETKDYERFKLLPGNRVILPAHVRHLAMEIAENSSLLRYRPILVNENMEVIDGQHRLEVAKKLNIPVWYEQVEGLDANTAIAMNKNQRQWTTWDYAKSYADQGRDTYRRFMELHELYPSLEARTLTEYMLGRSAGGHTMKHFRDGKFEPTAPNGIIEKQIDMALDVTSLIPELKRPLGLRALRLVQQHEAYDHERMMEKAAKYGELKIQRYQKLSDTIRNIEEIYNHMARGDFQRLY